MSKNTEKKMNLYPFYACAANANHLIEHGCTVHQQWLCSHCGTKQTMEKENAWYTKGKCEECQLITDIEQTGCNYLLIASSPEAHKAALSFDFPHKNLKPLNQE